MILNILMSTDRQSDNTNTTLLKMADTMRVQYPFNASACIASI